MIFLINKKRMKSKQEKKKTKEKKSRVRRSWLKSFQCNFLSAASNFFLLFFYINYCFAYFFFELIIRNRKKIPSNNFFTTSATTTSFFCLPFPPPFFLQFTRLAADALGSLVTSKQKCTYILTYSIYRKYSVNIDSKKVVSIHIYFLEVVRLG